MTTFRSEGHAGCVVCRTADIDGRWQSLKLVKTLDAGDLFPASVAWAGRTIEIRECPRCGRNTARVRRDTAH